MADVLLGSAAAVAAFVAAVVVVLCVAVVLHWGHDRAGGLIPYIFYPAILVVVLTVLFSGRNLYLPIEPTLVKHPVAVWASRGVSLFLLFAAAERIGRRFLHYGRKPDTPTALILAFWLYFLTNVVSNGLFGTRPSFSHEYLYTVLAGYAALLITREEGDAAVRSARNAFFIFLIVSALCIPWRPEMVFSSAYQGLLLPGLNVRYSGLGSHSNTLGPAVVAFLLCLWKMPYSTRWLNRLGWAIGCASLVLAQSKTSWVAFLVCASCFAYFRHGEFLAQRLFDPRRPLLPASLLLLAMLATSLFGVAFMFGDVAERVAAFFRTREGTDLLTLVGRDRIWEIAVQEWRNNPLFGYGLNIWNDDYRAQIGIPGAYHAHNQLYQSLGSAGILGVVGLSAYAATLLWFALKTARASQGLSFALFALLFLHSVTEVPLSMTAGYGPPQLMHLLLLMVIASQSASSRTARLGEQMPARYRLVSA